MTKDWVEPHPKPNKNLILRFLFIFSKLKPFHFQQSLAPCIPLALCPSSFITFHFMKKNLKKVALKYVKILWNCDPFCPIMYFFSLPYVVRWPQLTQRFICKNNGRKRIIQGWLHIRQKTLKKCNLNSFFHLDSPGEEKNIQKTFNSAFAIIIHTFNIALVFIFWSPLWKVLY